MKRDQQRLLDYLTHIVEAVERIDSYTKDMDEIGFLNSPITQDAVIRNLEIIGEATHNVQTYYGEFATAHPELPLSSAYQMRNAIAHGYFKVDLELVWKTLQTDLATLYTNIQKIIN